MGGAPRRIHDRRDGGAFPIEFAVPLLVVENPVPALPARDRSPQFLVDLRLSMAGLQETRIPPRHLRRGVAGKLDELRIHVFNVPGHISDHRYGRALLHRRRQLPELLLRPFEFGNVTPDALIMPLPFHVQDLLRHMDIPHLSLPRAVPDLEIHPPFLHHISNPRRGRQRRFQYLHLGQRELGKLLPRIAQPLMGRRVELQEPPRPRINNQDAVR